MALGNAKGTLDAKPIIWQLTRGLATLPKVTRSI